MGVNGRPSYGKASGGGQPKAQRLQEQQKEMGQTNWGRGQGHGGNPGGNSFRPVGKLRVASVTNSLAKWGLGWRGLRETPKSRDVVEIVWLEPPIVALGLYTIVGRGKQ